ncbi:hypothetical protein [Kitasatospora sp. McL0602]
MSVLADLSRFNRWSFGSLFPVAVGVDRSRFVERVARRLNDVAHVSNRLA